MVEKFNTIITSLENEYHQKLSLFVLMKTNDLADKWSILLAANWINESNRSEIFQKLASLMKESLSPEENELISRIGIFLTTDHVTQLFLQFKEGTKIDNQQVNGFFVQEAHVLRSDSQV